LLLSEVNDPDRYLGTPNDDRMVELFGDMFGSIHIGTGEVTSGDRVTDLEFIRWRASVLGAKANVCSSKRKAIFVQLIYLSQFQKMHENVPIQTAQLNLDMLKLQESIG